MQSIKLPKGWHEVSIDTYLKYHTLITSKITDPIDLEIKVISVLSGVEESEVEKVKTKDILAMSKGLAFLKELPKERIPYIFKCGGNVYKASLTMNDMTGGQFMNFSDVVKGVKPEDYVYHMTDLIACMCVKRERGVFFKKGKLSFTRWVYSGYKETSAVFKQHMSIAEAYPYYVFFCKVMEKLYPATRDYLMQKTKKLANKRKWPKWGFLNIGGGIRLWML